MTSQETAPGTLDLPPDPDTEHDAPAPPSVAFAELDSLPLVEASGVRGHTEAVLACVMEALRAGALVVTGPGLPKGINAVRIYRYFGPAWYRRADGTEMWCGRGQWYATSYVRGAGSRGTVNVYLGKWRTPGSWARVSANAKTGTPAPLSPAGIRRAVARIAAKVEGRPQPR